MPKKKFRIVRDDYLGYAVEVWRWYCPFWIEHNYNSHKSVDDARVYARQKSMPHVVEYYTDA